MNWYVKFYLSIVATLVLILGGMEVAHAIRNSTWVLAWYVVWVVGTLAWLTHVVDPWLDD